jgi:hypothetical protein
LSEWLTPAWHSRLPEGDGIYFVTDGKSVNIAQCGPIEPLFSFYDKGELREIANIHRDFIDTSTITHHTPVPYPIHWDERAPDEDGWYFIHLYEGVKIGYSYTEPYDGNVYYPVQRLKHAKVYIPSPP